MRTRTSVGILIVATALAVQPVFAKESGGSGEGQLQAKLAAQQEATRNLAHKMMGHINLASVALDTDLPKAALKHVEKAESLAARLSKLAPELRDRIQFKYGKVSYTVDDKAKDFYVPVVDDMFLLNDYKTTFHVWKDSPNIKETDAGVVLVGLSMDIREAQKALKGAESKIEAKDYDGASQALAQIFKDAVVDEVVLTDPAWAVHDDLAFAKNLIEEEHYDAARHALENARESLGKVEKESTTDEQSASVAKMRDEIAQLENELAQKDHSVVARVSTRLSGWMNTVESWVSER
jgi:hypothetical protein